MTRFSSIALVDSRGWILLQERDEHPEIDPDRWGFCGGHVDPGEDFLAAAYRELAEETGIVLIGGLTLYAEFAVLHEHSGQVDPVQLFFAATDLTDTDIECHEGRQIVFVDPDRARSFDLTTAARIALPEFLESASYRELLPASE